MSYQFNNNTLDFRQLKAKSMMTIKLKELVLVDTRNLPARNATLASLKTFYEDLLGLTYTGETLSGGWRFRLDERAIVLIPANRNPNETQPEPSIDPMRQLVVVAQQFKLTREILQRKAIPHIVQNDECGLHTAFIQDPAGNWVTIMESRPL